MNRKSSTIMSVKSRHFGNDFANMRVKCHVGRPFIRKGVMYDSFPIQSINRLFRTRSES